MTWFPQGSPWVDSSSGRPFMWFTDDLTLRDASGRIRWTCSHAFQHPTVRRENIELLKARGYNMTFVDQLNYVTKSHATEDAIVDPELLISACAELRRSGIKAVPRFGYEDARELLEEIGGIEGYVPHLKRAAELLAPHVDGWCLGKESFERFSPTEVELLARTLAVHGLPIAVHLGQGEWGPDGHEMSWWSRMRHAVGSCPLALAYQVTHPRVEDGGGAFTSDPETIRLQISAIKPRLKTVEVELLLAEHSYNGASLDAVVITEEHAQSLGDVGLAAGAISTQNGCTPGAISEALLR